MSKVTSAALLCLLLAVPAFASGTMTEERVDRVKGNPFVAFTTFSWGVGSHVVAARETGGFMGSGLSNWGGAALFYESDLIGLPCMIEYEFDGQDRLCGIIYYVTRRYLSRHRRLDDFAVLRGLLLREYGEPLSRVSTAPSNEPVDTWMMEALQARIRLAAHPRSPFGIVLSFGFTGSYPASGMHTDT